MGNYSEVFKRSIEDPDGFWGEAAEKISWYKKWDKVLDDSNKPFFRWFTGGELNTCYNCLDRHVEGGRGDQAAIIYDSPVTDFKQSISYNELLDQVKSFAGGLKSLGVVKGDTVVIYMPMVPQALVAMLACARLGAVHSVVFGGFAPKELAVRIDDAKPKVMVSASCGIEGKKVIAYKPLLDKAIEIASHKPEKCVILKRPQAEASLTSGRDVDWEELAAAAQPADCERVEGHRSLVHSLHLRHHRHSQGHCARQRRPRGGAVLDHEAFL
jgi:propionyl-CoA synthetase